MELLLKRVLVLIITTSVAVPSIYFTLTFHSNSQYEKNPVNYIPSSASFAGMIDSGYGIFYIFIENQSVGIITSLSVFMIPQLVEMGGNSANLTDEVTTNMTLSYYEEYHAISIFRLDGVNASAIVESFAAQSPIVSDFLNTTDVYTSLGDLTFFIASPQNTLSIIGTTSTVKDSIDAYISHSNLPAVKNVVFDNSCNVSLYYYPSSQLGLNHISLNMSYNYTEIFLGFTNLDSRTLLSLTSLAVKYDVQIYLHENSIELIVDRGIETLSGFIKDPGGLSQIVGGLPV